MIVAVYASLLLASAAQYPAANPDVAAPKVQAEEQNGDVNGQDPFADSGQTDDFYQPEQPTEATEQPVEQEAVEPEEEAVEEEPEPDQPMVCRRQTVFNEFGRQRSRKVCRPRDEW